MKPRKKPPPRSKAGTIAHFQQTRQKALAKNQRAKSTRLIEASVKKFRTRKSERLGYVFIGLNGRRLPLNERVKKGVLVYVTAKGLKRVVREPGGLKARRVPTYNLNRLAKNRKTAFNKLKATQSRQVEAKNYRRTKRERGGIDIRRVTELAAAQAFKIIHRRKNRGTVLIELTVHLKGHKSFTTTVNISENFKQKLTLAQYKKVLFQIGYAAIAQELKHRGLVSRGSSIRISRLAGNRGVESDEWVDKRGERWEKNEDEPVTITGIDTTFREVTLRG